MANNNAPVKPVKVRGTVEFYGYVDNYNKDGKEYVLKLSNYDFVNYDPNVVFDWYKDKDGKQQKFPTMFEELNAGHNPEFLYFRSDYPIDTIQIKKDDHVEAVKIDYKPDLTGKRIVMTMYKQFIGAIGMKELPPEFKKIAFDATEFDDL